MAFRARTRRTRRPGTMAQPAMATLIVEVMLARAMLRRTPGSFLVFKAKVRQSARVRRMKAGRAPGLIGSARGSGRAHLTRDDPRFPP